MTDFRDRDDVTGRGSRAPAHTDAVYSISVAAELVGTGPQNLRLYEARGLLTPRRTSGGTRRYSASDLEVLRRISDLLVDGLNLAGVAMVLALEGENDRLRATNARLETRSGGVD
jgi:DNA-binding transcriptional MerR regulator